MQILCNFDVGPLNADATDDTGNTAWTIFESRHQRCVHEDESIRAESMQAFKQILDLAKGRRARIRRVCTETIDENEQEQGQSPPPQAELKVAPLSPKFARDWGPDRRAQSS